MALPGKGRSCVVDDGYGILRGQAAADNGEILGGASRGNDVTHRPRDLRRKVSR